MQNSKILLVEDDEAQAQNILDRLGYLGCTISVVHTGSDGLDMVKNDRPDLIILDIMLSQNHKEREGFDVLRMLRADTATRTIPVIVYSILAEDIDTRLRSIGLGALWTLDKNDGIAELEAIVRRALEWTAMHNHPLPTPQKGLRFDPNTGTIWIDGEKRNISLSPLQTRLLVLLHQRRGHIVSRQHIAHYVYESKNRALDDLFDDDQIDALVSRLREKLGDNAQQQRFIETVWGQGFKLREEA